MKYLPFCRMIAIREGKVMRLNGYELTDSQKKELLSEFRNNVELWMYDDLQKIEKFLDDNKYSVNYSNDEITIHFTELNIHIAIKD